MLYIQRVNVQVVWQGGMRLWCTKELTRADAPVAAGSSLVEFKIATYHVFPEFQVHPSVLCRIAVQLALLCCAAISTGCSRLLQLIVQSRGCLCVLPLDRL